MKVRIGWLDNIRGIAIVLVVFGHFFPPIPIKMWIYSFHLALFFFLSGYLYKRRSLKEVFVVKVKSLIIPYLITAIASIPIGMFVSNYLGYEQQIVTDFLYWKGSIGWNTPIWFLLVLFIVEVGYTAIRKLNTFFIIFMSLGIGYLLYHMDAVLPFGLQIACWMLPFYCVGTYCNENKLFEKLKKSLALRIIGALFMALNGFMAVKINSTVAEVYHNQLGVFWLYYVISLIGICGMICLFYETSLNPILNLFSRKSLVILCTHYLFYYGFLFVNSLLGKNVLFGYQFIPSIFMLLCCLTTYYIMFNLLGKIRIR